MRIELPSLDAHVGNGNGNGNGNGIGETSVHNNLCGKQFQSILRGDTFLPAHADHFPGMPTRRSAVSEPSTTSASGIASI